MCRLSYGRAHRPLRLLLLRQLCNLSTSQPQVRYLHVVGRNMNCCGLAQYKMERGHLNMQSSCEQLDTQNMMPSLTFVKGLQ